MTEASVAAPLHYEADIKPLFRRRDQEAMAWAFDLHSYEDVSRHADAILARLRSGTMPCDGPWPDEQVQRFDKWAHGGKLP
jgi:hypothetical protein